MSDPRPGSREWLDAVPPGKIRARQHIPNFVDGFEPHFGEYDSTAALLDQDWIKRWEGESNGHKFHRWSLSDGTHLMAEHANGDHFWVVAYVRGPVDLPKWEMTERGKARLDEWNHTKGRSQP